MTRVLVIEDSDADRELIARWLARQGFGVSTAETLAQAASHDTPEVILLDLTLPDSHGGVRTVEQCRAIFPGVPVVVLTGAPGDTLGLDCVRAGAEDFVSKHGDADDLERRIRFAVLRSQSNLPAMRAILDQKVGGK